MPCERRRPLLVLLPDMLETCVVIDEDSGEKLEIGSFLYKQSNSARDPKRNSLLVFKFTNLK